MRAGQSPGKTRNRPPLPRILPVANSAAYAAARRCKIPDCLHRLDAWSGLPADVPDPLLRLVAQSPSPPKRLFHVLPVRRNLSCTLVSFLGRNLTRTGHGETASEKSFDSRHRPHYHLSRRTSLRVRAAFSVAGVPGGLGMGA